MMMKPLGKRRARLAAVLVVLAVVALSGWLGWRGGNGELGERPAGPPKASVREAEDGYGAEGRGRQRNRPEDLEAQRRAALDLVERMRGPAQAFPVTRMANVGEAFPKDLLDELAAMNAEQFQMVVLAIGRDRTIHGATRTTLVVKMVGAWMKQQTDTGRPQLEMVLGTIEELFPEFPPGHDVLPVNCVINPGAAWDAEAMASFVMKHWDRWGGPESRNAEMLRQSMLRYSIDPQVAFEQMKALGWPQDLKEGGQQIARGGSAGTEGPQAITATFERIQEEFGDGPGAAELRAGMVAGLGERLTVWSPGEVDAWLVQSGLSEEERGKLLESMSLPRNAQTAADWIRWVETRVPQSRTEEMVSALGNRWAFEDVAGAERWIAGLPEGRTRSLAVRGFLEVAEDPMVRERVGGLGVGANH